MVVQRDLMYNQRMIMLFFSLISLAVCIVSPAWGESVRNAQNTLTQADRPALKTKSIIVGGDINYKPFSYMDKQGLPQGHDVEVMNSLASQLGIRVRYKLSKWPLPLQDLKNGVVDAVIGVIYLDERKNLFDFTIPVWFESYSIFAGSDAQFRDFSDISLGKIAALRGDASIAHFINPLGLSEKTILFESLPDAIRAVDEGKSDFAIAPYSLGMQAIKDFKYRNIRIVGNPVLPSLYCIAVRKGNNELLEAFNSGIDALKGDGKIQTIDKKWFIQRPQEISAERITKIVAAVLFPVLAVLAALLLWSWSLRRQVRIKTANLQAVNEELTTALSEVRQLSGLLPICASCKKIRDDKGYWNHIETYISKHSEAQFSHGICPECCKKLYPNVTFPEPDK
jgi:ABC-type amino acid transport substrate-binding protein